ncbi:MAG: hopanoid biosynthesis-associated protein HpnK [Hyphomicrobiales bacterium]|nr:hopanoid biosynthesis-associated protein HpnK [Hyphomicrobiales bacterium]
MNARTTIVTADDFGLSDEVDEAIERAHLGGIVTHASLMVGGPSAAGAIGRAARMPRLGVGLHVALCEIAPTGPAPGLVDGGGLLRDDIARYGVALGLRPRLARAVEDQIEAQFDAFAALGLSPTHVDAHKHLHLHPVVGDALVRVAARRRVPRLRVPFEPRPALAAIEPTAPSAFHAALNLAAKRLARAARAAGVPTNDVLFGLRWSGAMSKRRLLGLLGAARPGATEIHVHPATAHGWRFHAPAYRYAEELAALTDPDVRAAFAAAGRG